MYGAAVFKREDALKGLSRRGSVAQNFDKKWERLGVERAQVSDGGK